MIVTNLRCGTAAIFFSFKNLDIKEKAIHHGEIKGKNECVRTIVIIATTKLWISKTANIKIATTIDIIKITKTITTTATTIVTSTTTTTATITTTTITKIATAATTKTATTQQENIFTWILSTYSLLQYHHDAHQALWIEGNHAVSTSIVCKAIHQKLIHMAIETIPCNDRNQRNMRIICMKG